MAYQEEEWTMSEDTMIGESVIRYEPDTGFIFVAQVGEVDAARAAELLEAVRQMRGSASAVYMITDGRRGTGINAEARKVFSRGEPIPAHIYVAMFGATFGFRAIVNLVFKAISFISDQVTPVMVANEAEAREWLTKKKAAHKD